MTPNNFRVKSGLSVGNNANITGYVNASSYVNATSFNVGATVIANSTGVYATHLNGSSGAGYALLSGGLFTGAVNATSYTVGATFTANATLVNTAAINVTGAVNTATLYAATSANIASVVQANSTGIFTSGTANAATLSVGTAFIANTTRVVVGTATGLQANGDIGTAGQVLTSNATTVYWSTPTTGTVTSIATANGISGGTITSTGTIGLTTGSTLTVNSTGAHVNSALSITSLTTSGDVQIGGNLTVLGDLLTINVATLAVEDSLIQLASNNTSSDLLDIGFFGSYEAGDGGAHEHTGLFRDATDGIYKLFVNLEESPTSTVNTSGTGYSTGTLQTYLSSGGLVSNSTAVTLTSNSTLAVNITGNTAAFTSLSLAGALSGVTTAAMGNTTITGFAAVSSARGAVATPTAGQNNSALYVTGSDTAYGLLFGTDPATGRSWIQSQRTDGTATTYALRLNPAGGITEFGAGYTEAEVANTSATGTWTMDCSAANFFELTLTGSITISPTNVPASTRIWSGTIVAKQDATGGRTITWPTGIKWPGGSAPPATTTANAIDIWSLMTYDGGSTWVGSLSVKNVA